MKKFLTLFILLLAAMLFTACPGQPDEDEFSYEDVPASMTITQDDFVINGNGGDWFFWTQSLDEKLYGQEVTFTFSCDMLIENAVDEGYLMWQVNNGGAYPKIATCDFKTNETEYKTVTGSEKVNLASNAIFYLSNYNEPASKTFNNANFTIHIKNFSLKIDYMDRVPVGLKEEDYWLNAISLKEAFKNTGIEHIGLAVTESELMRDSEKQKGLAYHATSTTMGNEFKPDFLFNWSLNSTTGKKAKFTASNGLTIDVPATLSGFTRADQLMAKCKELGIKMRGHVLVWYSQTPKAFFCENYNESSSFVDKDTMTARQEWYIKTVLEHVAAWEAENMPEGEHLIYTWDVVNEALSDGASSGAYLRSPDNSNWAKVYGKENYEFIINAFRFANKYAPADVLLAYNDYNEASGNKYYGYLKIIDEIQAHEKDAALPTRIDIAGMQSHNQPGYPSVSDYERAIKSFIDKGLDVQVTELDVTGSAKDSSYQTFNAPTAREQKSTYKSYFNIYLNYAKTEGKAHGVTGVTFWGINDEDSWHSSGKPLLFRKISGKYYVKDAYYGVIETVK